MRTARAGTPPRAQNCATMTTAPGRMKEGATGALRGAHWQAGTLAGTRPLSLAAPGASGMRQSKPRAGYRLQARPRPLTAGTQQRTAGPSRAGMLPTISAAARRAAGMRRRAGSPRRAGVEARAVGPLAMSAAAVGTRPRAGTLLRAGTLSSTGAQPRDGVEHRAGFQPRALHVPVRMQGAFGRRKGTAGGGAGSHRQRGRRRVARRSVAGRGVTRAGGQGMAAGGPTTWVNRRRRRVQRMILSAAGRAAQGGPRASVSVSASGLCAALHSSMGANGQS